MDRSENPFFLNDSKLEFTDTAREFIPENFLNAKYHKIADKKGCFFPFFSYKTIHFDDKFWDYLSNGGKYNFPSKIDRLIKGAIEDGVKTLIYDVDIVLKSTDSGKYHDILNGSGSEKANFLNYYYEMITPDFWVENSIFPKNFFWDDSKYFQPDLSTIEDVFFLIWENFCIFEGRSRVTRFNFFKDFSPLSRLIIDVLSKYNVLNCDYKTMTKKVNFLFDVVQDSLEFPWEGESPLVWSRKPLTVDEFFQFRVRDFIFYVNNFGNRDFNSAFELFFIKIVKSAKKGLIDRGLALECGNCSNLFEYKKDKVYCSDKCRRSKNNSKHYQKNRSRILPKARKYQREYREL